MILFQAPIPNWPTAVVEICKYAVPAIITAVATIYITRFAYKTKLTELKSASELKARELLFQSYQKKIEAANAHTANMGAQLGNLVPIAKQEDEESLNALILL